MISVQQAQGLLGLHVPTAAKDTCALAEGQGRVLLQDLVADRDGPPFHRVAMDGVAIALEAWRGGRRRFFCGGMQAAGDPQMHLTGPEQCLEAMTGAALPVGCSGVVPFEHCRKDGSDYVIDDDFDFFDMKNIHRQGEDFRVGDVVLPANLRLQSPSIAVAASLGYGELLCAKTPSIAWVTTGSELVDVDAKPLPHQIRKSNLHTGVAACRSRGYSRLSCHHLPDDEQTTRSTLAVLLEEHDYVILSGGVSKGKLDFVPAALEALGVEKVFHRVAQKPGKPLWFGVKGQRRVFGLPGNPASMLVCLERYVLPFLDRQAGLAAPPLLRLPCAETFPAKSRLTLFKTARVVDGPSGASLELCRDHGSGDHAALARGQGFVEIPPADQAWPAGTLFPFRYWS
jgi:molybdopterin molybdotransferase